MTHNSTPADELAEYGYARRLFEALLEKHYPESIATALPDLMGVLTQIDNLTTGLTRQPPTIRNAVIEECANVAEAHEPQHEMNTAIVKATGRNIAKAIRALAQDNHNG